jgi:arylsulfatase
MRFRSVVAVLPWETTLRLLAALVVGLLLAAVARRVLTGATTRRAAYAALAAVLVGTGIFAVMLSPTRQIAHDILVSRLLSTRLALMVVTPPLDFDGDGYISVFGGGDCRPFDSSVHPSAIDVPENDIDEDCADGDLDSDDVDLWGRWDYPVNQRVARDLPIILITNDTFAARHMSALGYDRPTTPHIDRFAKRSAFFVNTFTQGPSTRLSFPSMFTSRWDSQIARELIGKHPYPILPENETIAEILKEAGYQTTAVIPATYFLPSRWRGLLQGFDRVIDGPARAYNERKNDHTAAAVTKAALDVVRKKHDKPLFLWVHYFDSHSPHVAPKGDRSFGKDEKAVYDAELRHVDAEIGKLLRGIEKATRGKALVILTGDHGIGFDKPRHAKRHYGQDINTISLHVPMIVRAPFVKPRRIDAIATTLDIAPTIANLLELKGDFAFQGVSLVPSLIDGKDVRPQHTFHQFYIHESLWKGTDPLRHIGVRTERYNFLLDRTKGEAELYDWTTDYEERKNLVDSHPEVASELRSTLMLYLWHVTGRRGDEKQGVRPLRLAVGKLPTIAVAPEPEAAAEPDALGPDGLDPAPAKAPEETAPADAPPPAPAAPDAVKRRTKSPRIPRPPTAERPRAPLDAPRTLPTP